MDDQPLPQIIAAQCGNCAFWTPAESRGPVAIGAKARGICKGVPPTPHPQYDRHGNLAGQRDFWPCPPEDSYCALFAPRSDLLPGEAPPFEGRMLD